jgi:hypothetical protein
LGIAEICGEFFPEVLLVPASHLVSVAVINSGKGDSFKIDSALLSLKRSKILISSISAGYRCHCKKDTASDSRMGFNCSLTFSDNCLLSFKRHFEIHWQK